MRLIELFDDHFSVIFLALTPVLLGGS